MQCIVSGVRATGCVFLQIGYPKTVFFEQERDLNEQKYHPDPSKATKLEPKSVQRGPNGANWESNGSLGDDFWSLLAPLRRYWLPFWPQLGLKWVPKIYIFVTMSSKIEKMNVQEAFQKKRVFVNRSFVEKH